MVGAALDGDYDRARSLHHELGSLFRELFVETNPIPVKEAMAIRGYGPLASARRCPGSPRSTATTSRPFSRISRTSRRKSPTRRR